MSYMQKRRARPIIFLVWTTLALGWPSLSYAQLDVKINLENVEHGKIRVAKRETRNQDVVTSGPIFVEGTLNGDCVSLGGPIDIHGEVLGDIVSLGGPITITGTVKGGVASMGGPIKVSGIVKGDVSSLGGGVTLTDHATVLGDVALIGGKLNKSDTAVLKGKLTHLDWSMMKRFAPLLARYGKGRDIPETLEKVSVAYRVIRYAAFLAFTAGIGLMVILLTVFLPKQIETVAEAIKQDFWKSVGIGALILMLIFPGLLLMLVSVLGIPLVPMAILLICAAVLMSLAAFSLILTERLYGSLKKPSPTTLVGVGIGYVLLTSLLIIGKLMKVAGSIGSLFGGIFILANMMVLCCAVVVGLGAIWTTRMGSRKNGTNAAVPPAALPVAS
jgi:hypothetical protein